MAFSYKTPGAYIEEIVKLPPSVAQVETAIPIFIGVTQKATEVVAQDLKDVSKKIGSLADYELYYGYPDIVEAKVEINLNVPSNPSLSKDYVKNMYYAIMHYFDNGGGPCYIHSIGTYTDAVDATSYKSAIGKLDLVDEVTIVVLPDIGLLGDVNKIYDVYNIALQKASDLQDKFVVIDVRMEKTGDKFDAPKSKASLRNSISNNTDSIKYGAAYFPDLKTTYSFDFNTAIISMMFSTEIQKIEYEVVINSVKTKVKTYELLNELDYKSVKFLYKLYQAITDLNKIAFSNEASSANAEALTYFIGNKTDGLAAYFNHDPAKLEALRASKNALMAPFLSNIYSLDVDRAQALTVAADAKVNSATTKEEAIAKGIEGATSAVNAASLAIKAAETINDATNKALAETAKGKADTALAEAKVATTKAQAVTASGKALVASTEAEAASVAIKTGNGFGAKKDAFIKLITDEIQSVYTGMSKKPAGGDNTSFTTLQDTFLLKIGFFFNSLFETKLKEAFLTIPVQLPPSPAIAGIYGMVDRTRGVWKAPANVSVNAVVKPVVHLSDLDQEDFNVDAENGKSINCIRAFVGRGNLVWGARTLAGNNNEWRYINVRRFFNMVEESCQNASRQFIFEPNDANTWVRVKGMIDNFLTNLWRDGALQGAKPEHAFYTAVGLNQTMTQDDILNGILIVEVGLAVVRPAEFIILRFSHKLAVS